MMMLKRDKSTERSRGGTEPVVGEARGREVQEAGHALDLRPAVLALEDLRARARRALETAHQARQVQAAPERRLVRRAHRAPRVRMTRAPLRTGQRGLQAVVLAAVADAVRAPLAIHCRHTRANST